MFGCSGPDAFKEELFRCGQENFPTWTILRGLDMDDHTGNFGTVDILRGVQWLGYYERGVFQNESTMSRKALELEAYATKCFPYKTYTSEIGQRNIAFKYEYLVRLVLVSLGLLEKLILGCFRA